MIQGAPRYALVALWTTVGVLALRRRGEDAAAVRGWWLTACLGLSLATIQLWHWDVALWQSARRLLRSWGVYQDRGWIKVALAIVLVLFAVAALWRFGAVFPRLAPGLRLALGATLVMTAFVILKTLSLDRVLPRALFEQPGRYVFEFTTVGLVLLGCLLPRKVPR